MTLRRATCIKHRVISPLIEGDEVEILEMAPEEECEHEMFVFTKWRPKNLAIAERLSVR